MEPKIYSLTNEQVPTVLGLDSKSNLVIGVPARDRGLHNVQTTRRFKMDLGSPQDDSHYEQRRGAAGQIIPANVRKYHAAPEDVVDIAKTKSFSPLEATENFLDLLIPKDDSDLKQLVVGEPPLPPSWRENYRNNIKEVMSRLGFNEPSFFFEPFAIFQYYRHVAGKISPVDEQQIILVIDFGGGTFNCCVIQTTQKGQLSRSGSNSIPLGSTSSPNGGTTVDQRLCNLIHQRAKKELGLKFKEDPKQRASSSSALLIIEDAKIELSKKIRSTKGAEDGDDESLKILKDLKVTVSLPPKSFHPTEGVELALSGYELREEIVQLWRKKREGWGETVIRCMKSAEKKLNDDIEKIDVVIVAGGSAQLPFIQTLVRTVLRPGWYNDDTVVVIGEHNGSEVAQGLAVECRELSRKHSGLVTNRLVSCLEDSIYLRVGQTKAERLVPTVKSPKSLSNRDDGLLYQSFKQLVEKSIQVKLEIRKKPKGVLHYWFYGSSSVDADHFNLISTTVKIPGGTAVDKKFDLELKIASDGEITPVFLFYRSGGTLEKIQAQPFYFGNPLQGKKYVGIDFGTCNSYVSELLIPETGTNQASYPDYTLDEPTRQRLITLNSECEEFQKSISQDLVLENARENDIHFVFHNNKIEGNTLTLGQTQSVIRSGQTKQATEADREAVNLHDAYLWMLENYNSWSDQFGAFVRTLNQKLLRGLSSGEGKFREQDIDISGVDFNPPPWGSVDEFMAKLGDEVIESKGSTSGLELAVRAHTKLVSIHPFIDGNGRTARLLMSAILLSYGLPVVVLNSSDKQRYLAALETSNKGSLDSLVLLFSEILRETLATLTEESTQVEIYGDDKKQGDEQRPSKLEQGLVPTKNEDGDFAADELAGFYKDLVSRDWKFRSHIHRDIYRKLVSRNNRYIRLCGLNAPKNIRENEMKLLQEAIDDYIVHSPPNGTDDSDNKKDKTSKARDSDESIKVAVTPNIQPSAERLKSLLKGKKISHGETLALRYPPWKSAYEKFRQEFKAMAEGFDDLPDVRASGYELKFDEFDIIDEERFDSLWRRREFSRTWFCSLAFSAGFNATSVLFQFERRSEQLAKLERSVAPVSCVLTIGGERNGDWRVLAGEPIQLREIGYARSRLVYLTGEQTLLETDAQDVFSTLVGDLIEMTD